MNQKLHQEYDADFYAWIMHNAALLREGINRLAVLLSHLLKWQFQTELQGKSWKHTIGEQRESILDLLEDSPSLRHGIEEKIAHAYKKALTLTERDTGLPKKNFSKKCPFTLDECLAEDFLPES